MMMIVDVMLITLRSEQSCTMLKKSLMQIIRY